LRQIWLHSSQGAAAAECNTAVVLFIDELQYIREYQLAAFTVPLFDGFMKRTMPFE
jgi:hypothetical protein